MFRTNSSRLHEDLEQLQQATHNHAVWRDRLLHVISGRRPCDPEDLAPDAHHHCPLGRWYFERPLPELRELPSFAMLGAEHAVQHRCAAALLLGLATDAHVVRPAIEEFEEASARLSYALYFVKREIECSLQDRDELTNAHSAGTMMRDLREWHALLSQPGLQCCIAVMKLDDVREIIATHGHAARARAVVAAVNVIAAHLRLTDEIFRYDGDKFLIRLSGTDLASGKKMIMRLRETVTHGVASAGMEGVAIPVTASFGIALLDPEVDPLESIDRADHALTLARSAGRNQVIVWDPSVTTGVRLRRLELKDVEG